MKPLTPKDLKEMESRAHMCEEATIPGDRLRALIHTAQLAHEMKEALSSCMPSDLCDEGREALALWKDK